MLYRQCPACGSNLDPGERCDCTDQPHNEIISRKGVITNVSHSNKDGSNVPPRRTNCGGICEPGHGIGRGAILA